MDHQNNPLIQQQLQIYLLIFFIIFSKNSAINIVGSINHIAAWNL
jgi:hypothetical protein